MSTSPNIYPRKRASKTSTSTSDPPQIVLPPYQDELKQLIPALQLGNRVTNTLNKPAISSISTQLRGRLAQNITFDISQSVALEANSEYPYGINVYEDGELRHFSVSVNDINMYVLCVLYDEQNRPTVIADDNMLTLAKKGKGLTVGEATATDHNGISLDKGGRPHPVATYLSRSKHTFSYGHVADNYDDVNGTDFDKYYVIEYAPSIPHPYKRIFFTIQNRGENSRLIHEATVKRIAYVDQYELVISDKLGGNGNGNGKDSNKDEIVY